MKMTSQLATLYTRVWWDAFNFKHDTCNNIGVVKIFIQKPKLSQIEALKRIMIYLKS